MTEPSNRSSPRKRTLAVLGVTATALLVAIASAIGGGLGNKALDAVDKDSPLVTASAMEQVNECGTPLFVPEATADRLAANSLSIGPDWKAFKGRSKAVVADQDVVVVSIQGESSRTITLTGIKFEVEPHARPGGAAFAKACGDSITGRFLEVDLDRRPAAVVDSASSPKGQIGGESETGTSRYKPIRFPWTVSVTDPLLLNIVATTRRCACNWRAYISWSSGEKSGRLPIDNRGAGYGVVGIEGLNYFVNDGPKRAPWHQIPNDAE